MRQLPVRLQVGINVPHEVALIAAFRPFNAIIRRAVVHHEVFIPATIFAQVFVVQAGGERHRHQQLPTVGPAGVDPLIVALHVDHAASMRWPQLRLVGD